MEFGKGIREYRVFTRVNVQYRAFNCCLSIPRAPPEVASDADTTSEDSEGNKKRETKGRGKQSD